MKKFWCNECRIFIEFTKMSIDQHKRSKKHQYMINREQVYKAQKEKLQRHTDYLRESDNSDKQLGKKTSRSNIPANNKFLEEIKREIQQEKIMATPYNKMKKRKEKVWAVFWDQSSEEPYYYNFITKQSQWERPVDYDGPELEDNKPAEYSEDLKRGTVGQWETVEKGSIFGKRSEKEWLLPGEVNSGECVVEDEYDEIIQYEEPKRTATNTIDKYIYEDEESQDNNVANRKKTTQESKNEDWINQCADDYSYNNEDLVKINNKLKKYDTESILYVDPIKETIPTTMPDKIEINFKPVNKKNKRPIIL
jgi:hypothetical protein